MDDLLCVQMGASSMAREIACAYACVYARVCVKEEGASGGRRAEASKKQNRNDVCSMAKAIVLN